MKKILNNIGYPILGLIFCIICWLSPSVITCIKFQYFDFEKFVQLEDYRIILIIVALIFAIWLVISVIINYIHKNKPCLIQIYDDNFGNKLDYKSKIGYGEKIEFNATCDVKSFRNLDDVLEKLKIIYYKNDDLQKYKSCIVYGIARTPYIFLIGYLYADLGRKYSYVHNFREKDNKHNGLRILKEVENNNDVVLKHEYNKNSNTNDLVVFISSSYEVDDKYDYYFQNMTKLVIETSKKGVDIIDSNEMIDSFANEICNLIRKYSTDFQRIHLFISSSPSFTFKLGTKLGKNSDPDIFVYDYNRDLEFRRNWAIHFRSSDKKYEIFIPQN